MFPKNTEIQNKLLSAQQFFEQGNFAESENMLKTILKSNPDNAEAWYQLGLIANKFKKNEIAIELVQRAINIKNAEEYNITLGNIFFELKNFDDAINCYQKILEINPNYISAYNNLGVAFEKKGLIEKAIDYYKKAITLKPDNASAYCNLGVAFKTMNKTDESINCYRKVLEINPNYAPAYYNLGVSFIESRNVTNAIKYYEKTLEINPRYTDAYLNLGIAYLLNKDFEKGWQYYEWRFGNNQEPSPNCSIPKPKWNGESLKNKIIYIYHEQGIGDTLQFVRFLPMLKSLGAKKVAFKCQAGLENLLRTSLSEIDIIDNSTPDESVKFDTYIPLLSLPKLLKIKEDNIPQDIGYLKADNNKVIEYKQRFFNNDKYKIGIFWQGSRQNKDDKNRSIPLELFYPILNLPNIEFYSLQKGDGIEQLKDLPENLKITNLGDTFKDFSDTAAAIKNLDLVITIDSSVAHLAGSLGMPVWIILQSTLEWRWFLEEKETPWYKSAKLFRPKLNCNKTEVITRIIEELRSISGNF